MHSNLQGCRRRPLQRRPGGAVLLLLITLARCASAEIIDRIAVIVNGDVIAQSEIDAVQKLGLNVSGLPAAEGPVQDRIDHHLVLQQILRQPPITVPPERAQQVIDSYVQKYGGMEEFRTFLQSIGMNFQDFDTELREQLHIQAFVSMRFRPFVNVTIDDAERYYNDVFKPRYENRGQPAPAFAASFDQIQQEIVESQVQDRTSKWLEEIRRTSTINVKE